LPDVCHSYLPNFWVISLLMSVLILVMQHFKTTLVKRTISTILFLLLTTFIYSQNSKTKIEENRFIERSENKFGITDSLKNVIIPFIYDFIEFKNQRLIIRNNNANQELKY
jgi:hypothetical protein